MIAALLLAAVTPTERWSCVWPNYPDKKPLAATFELEGRLLTDEASKVAYQVVLDQPDALVAIYPSVASAGAKSEIRARTILINRRTGDMILARVKLNENESEDRPAFGQCGNLSLPKNSPN